MYFEDGFQKPYPFSPDVAVDIDDVAGKKIDMADAHISQVYEWLPWLGGYLDQLPADPVKRKELLKKHFLGELSPAVRAALNKWYGTDAAGKIKFAEAFEICEYGTQPGPDDIRRLFPFLPSGSR